MAEKTSAIRIWSLQHAPAALVSAAPSGYDDGAGVVAVYGGTPRDENGNSPPPQEWADNLTSSLGLTAEAQATVVLVHVPAFLWCAYWRPGGGLTG